MDMIERVARAICQERCATPFGDPPCWAADNFDGCQDDTPCSGIARAAIEAMREPTEEMLEAGMEASPMGRVEYDDGTRTGKKVSYSDHKCREIFHAIIDRALNKQGGR